MVVCYSLIFQGMGLGVRTDGRTDSHVTTKIFEIDGFPNFLRYGAPFERFRRAGAPLINKLLEKKCAREFKATSE